MRPWNPGDISVVVIITLYLISCSSTDYVFISKDSNLQWTLPDVSYPDPSFIKNIVPTMDIISSQGFPVERHFIQTEDGYILALHRIPSQGVPVLLMHGFAGASDMWVFRNDTTTDLLTTFRHLSIPTLLDSFYSKTLLTSDSSSRGVSGTLLTSDCSSRGVRSQVHGKTNWGCDVV
ncbi:uncharacterized protein LOC103506828 [Diaphorina citri]|uniref:Uncharacterized protein LOC103506828 n=1 Tax=Diaphorina citri TaxID=121845 RepID=A0A1S4E8Z1_DIACI|nr:uncharacterized protein LOC103506828 [Diaphorina citri]